MAGSHEVIGSNPLSSTLTLIFIVSIQSPGGLAQLGEHMAGSHEVIGSNPLSSTLTLMFIVCHEVIGSNPLSSTFCFLLRPVLGAHFFEPGMPGFFYFLFSPPYSRPALPEPISSRWKLKAN